MRRHQPARADAGHEESTREREFSSSTVRLTVCRAGDIVAGSEKGRFNFLFPIPLLRLWLTDPRGRPVLPELRAGEYSGILLDGVKPNAPLDVHQVA